MIDATHTPYLLIVGDLLAQTKCGLVCHGEDLDRLKLATWSRHSASPDMAVPVVCRLLRVMLDSYEAPRRLNKAARAERSAISAALASLEGVNWSLDNPAPPDPPKKPKKGGK